MGDIRKRRSLHTVARQKIYKKNLLNFSLSLSCLRVASCVYASWRESGGGANYNTFTIFIVFSNDKKAIVLRD
jgi:hypothetical protein